MGTGGARRWPWAHPLPPQPNDAASSSPDPLQSPSTRQLSIESIANPLTLLNNLTTFHRKDRQLTTTGDGIDREFLFGNAWRPALALGASPSRRNQTMPQAYLPTPPQSPSTRQLSIEPIANSLTLLNNLTAFYQQERYWTHHTRAALESALASTVQGTITRFTDVDDINSSLTSSTLSSATVLPDNSDDAPIKTGQPTPKTKTMDLQQRRRNKKKNNLHLKLANITPPILKQQGTRPSQRILEMFAELVEFRMESCERVTNMVKRYRRDRDIQMQRVV